MSDITEFVQRSMEEWHKLNAENRAFREQTEHLTHKLALLDQANAALAADLMLMRARAEHAEARLIRQQAMLDGVQHLFESYAREVRDNVTGQKAPAVEISPMDLLPAIEAPNAQ